MRLLGVTGCPILFSKSPTLFKSIFKEAALENNYFYTRIAADSIEEAISLSEEIGFHGINITAPFKESAFTQVDDCSLEAKNIGAINTILFKKIGQKNLRFGLNTDPSGVMFALKGFIKNLDSKHSNKAVILGNGGAAKACKEALQSIGIQSQCLARSTKLDAILFSNPNALTYFSEAMIVISTIPAEVTLPTGFYFNKNAVFLDATYKVESRITNEAKKQNIKIAKGINWLIGQGRTNFYEFTKDDSADSNKHIPESFWNTLPNELKIEARNNSVYLIGLMGSGKSAVLDELSKKGFSTADVDQLIEKKEGISVREIFEQKGESYFRQIEHEVLKQIKADFISCGGGVVTTQSNHTILQSGVATFWLWSSLDVLTKRLSSSSDRPLLRNKDILSTLQSLLKDRFDAYLAFSDIIIRSDTRSTTALAEKILQEVRSIK